MTIDELAVATTARELIDKISELTARPDPPAADAAEAVTALGHLGRALRELAAYNQPIEPSSLSRRRNVTRGLSLACRAAAAQGPTAAGRLPDLAGAIADTLVRHTATLEPDERWALAVEVGAAARSCVALAARFAPYTNVRALRRAHRAQELLSQVAQMDPPSVAARAPLDRVVPTATRPPLTAPASVRAIEAAAGMLGAVEQQAHAGTLDLLGILAACAAAEITARNAALLTANSTAHAHAVAINGVAINGAAGRRAPQAWQIVQAALLRFDDGSRYRSTSTDPVTTHALRLQQAITALTTKQGDNSAAAVTAVQHTVDLLPALAERIEAAVTRWSDRGVLFARARSLPHTEDRVDALIHDRAVMVTPRDVGPVLVAARVAARLSGTLAVELDQTANQAGRQPHPHLIAALSADLRPMTTTRDASWVQRLTDRLNVPNSARDTVARAYAPVR